MLSCLLCGLDKLLHVLIIKHFLMTIEVHVNMQRRQDMRHNCTIQLFKLKTWHHVKYYGDWRKQLTLSNYLNTIVHG